jgi:predicted ATPase
VRIHRVTVENFRGLRRFELDLCRDAGEPRPFTVLVGPNMSGKTTVLDALHLAYACIDNAADPQFRPDLDPADPTLRPDPNQPISVAVEFSLHEGEWEAIDETERTLGTQGLSVSKATLYGFEFRWPPPAKSHHGVTRSKPFAANLAFRGRAVAKVAKSKRLVGEGVFERIGGLVYLDQHRTADLRAPSTTTGSEEALREGAGSRDVLPWLELVSRLHARWDPSAQGESAWSRVRRLYAALAAPAAIDDVKAFDEGFDLRFHRDGAYYYSAGLSSGERQILRLVANLVSQRATRSVVLVDELELHLHPSWQRNLIHFCRQGGDDDNQFIVTTHSESILRYVAPEDVVVLGALDSDASR